MPNNASNLRGSPEDGEWRLRCGSDEFGPYTKALLHDWASQGKLPAGAQVSGGDGRWLTIQEFIQGSEQNGNGTTPQVASQILAPAASLQDVALNEMIRVSATPLPLPSPAGQIQPHMPAAAVEDEGTPVRDRIVILGRSRSGKTVYLASLYNILWRRTRGFTAKALTGSVHKQLMTVIDELHHGRWPAATQGNTQVELEVEYNGVKRLLVTLDFAGELFARAFVHDQHESDEIKPLIRTIDRAAAVLLIVDPAVVAGQDHAAAMEDDFGLVQAVERIRNWPGGQDVPIVLVLSKSDTHQALLDKHGGMIGFVQHYFPALSRTLRKIPIYQVSAVQSVRLPNGKILPKIDSVQINVEKPLMYCLEHMNLVESRREQERQNEAIRMETIRLEREEERRAKRSTTMVVTLIIVIGIIGIAILGLIVYWKW